MYKIYNRNKGLYARGGSRVSWSKDGKIWAERGHLGNHLAQFTNPEVSYRDCEIVEVDVVTLSAIPIIEWVNGIKDRREKRNAAARRRQEQRRNEELERTREKRRLQWEELQKEFGR